MPKYLHFLRTGSGSNIVELDLNDDAALLIIRSAWMGKGAQQFNLSCRRHVLSGSFGLLEVERIETSTKADGPFEIVTPFEEELLPLVLEYVTVPQSPVYVHGASQLAMMRPLGYATWNDDFELVLMVHDVEGRAPSSPLLEICDILDKKKFAAWTPEAEARQSARERADAGASLQTWNSILGNQKQ